LRTLQKKIRASHSVQKDSAMSLPRLSPKGRWLLEKDLRKRAASQPKLKQSQRQELRRHASNLRRISEIEARQAR